MEAFAALALLLVVIGIYGLMSRLCAPSAMRMPNSWVCWLTA